MKNENLEAVKSLQTVIDIARAGQRERLEHFRTEHSVMLLNELRNTEATPEALLSILDECDISGVRFEEIVRVGQEYGESDRYIYLTGLIVIGFLIPDEEEREISGLYGDAEIISGEDCDRIVNSQELATRKITAEEGAEVFEYMKEMYLRESEKEDFAYLLEKEEE